MKFKTPPFFSTPFNSAHLEIIWFVDESDFLVPIFNWPEVFL